MDELVAVRDSMQEYACSCIANVYQSMGSYGDEWGALKHLFNVLAAWSIIDQEIRRLSEDE